MADISKIQISDIDYDLKDKVAREQIEGKQDVLVPNDPLKIETVTKSHTNNISYTSDLSKIYNTDGTKGARMILYSRGNNRQNLYSNATSPGYFQYSKATTGYTPVTKEDWLGGYIDIPYTFGDIIKIPRTVADGNSQATLGKTLADGTYIPILPLDWTSSNVSNQYINKSDNLYFTTYYGELIIAGEDWGYEELFSSTKQTSVPSVSFTGLPTNVVYIHMSLTNNVLKYDQLLTATNTGAPHNYVLTTTVTSSVAARLSEINTIRWTTYGAFGQNSTSPVEISRFGAYHNSGNKDIARFSSLSAIEAESYFDLTEITQTTYLDLKVDNQTVKVNSDGNLEADFSSLVSKAGATMTGDLTIAPATNKGVLYLKNSTLNYETVNTEAINQFGILQFRDKNNNYAGYFQCEDNASANLRVLVMSTRRKVNDADKYALLQLSVDANGNDTAYLSPGVRSYFSGLSTPSTRFNSLTLGASGTTYVAPANGWVSILKTSNGTGQYMTLVNVTKNILIRTNNTAVAVDQSGLLLPVSKGDTFRVDYSYSGATNAFKFIYSEGDK